MPDQIQENKRRAATLVGGVVAVVGIVLGLLGLLLLGWIGLIIGFVLAGAAAAVFVRRSTAMVLVRAGGRPADDVAHARLRNVVEGLCVAGGLPVPALYVLEEPSPNALTCGRNPRDAGLVVTSGLLDGLSRIELEGVMAHELSHIKGLDILPGTLAAAIPGAQWLAGRLWSAQTAEALADLQAVGMTRYPPGLLAALEKLQADSSTMQPRSPSITHLWLKPPETGGRGGEVTPPLEERIEALKEL